jgi:hypothetical protein
LCPKYGSPEIFEMGGVTYRSKFLFHRYWSRIKFPLLFVRYRTVQPVLKSKPPTPYTLPKSRDINTMVLCIISIYQPSPYLRFGLIRQPLRIAIRLCITIELPPLGRPLGHPLHEVLGRIERSTRLCTTCGTSLRLPVVLQRTLLAEIMLAARAHRVHKFLVANAALVRQVVILRDDVFVLVGRGVVARLEFLVHLPAVFVVGAVVHEFAGVAETAVARLFVVLDRNNILKMYQSTCRTSVF